MAERDLVEQLLLDLYAAALTADAPERELPDGRFASVTALYGGRGRIVVARRRGATAYDDGW